jgi:uncharacterized protein YkwD
MVICANHNSKIAERRRGATMSVRALIVAMAVGLGTVVPAAAAPPASAAPPTPAAAWRVAPQMPVAGVIEPAPGLPHAVPAAALTSQVVTRTNQLRHAHGCGQLAVDHDLIVASVRQSYYMAATRRFGHRGPGGSTFVTRARAAGYAQPAGENIAWGYETAAAVVGAWMASPRHRANILNCGARSIGAGVVYALDGTPYYTEVFGWI